MTRAERRKQRTEQFEFVARWIEIDNMTADEFAAYRRAEVKRLTPPLEPFIWDGRKDAAHNVAALHEYERELARRQWAA